MDVVQLEALCQRFRAFVDEFATSRSTGRYPKELFHYSPPAGFHGIISSRTIWASSLFSTNDASEGSYFHGLIRKFALGRHSPIPHLLRISVTSVLKDTWTSHRPFIACFCRNRNQLSQWRGYGNAGKGYSIGFDVKALIRQNPQWQLLRVIYNRRLQLQIVREYFQLASREWELSGLGSSEELVFWRSAIAQLVPLAIMFKHPDFKEEREYRITNTATPLNIKARPNPSGGVSKPTIDYVEIGLQGDSLTRVVRGPYYQSRPNFREKDLVLRNGFLVPITDSSTPLRC